MRYAAHAARVIKLNRDSFRDHKGDGAVDLAAGCSLPSLRQVARIIGCLHLL